MVYTNITEIILICFTIYLLQTVTAFNENQIHCFKEMEAYCTTDLEEEEEANEVNPNNIENEEQFLLERLIHLTAVDCAKAEIIKWTEGETWTGDSDDYRQQILGNIKFDLFNLPMLFCARLYPDDHSLYVGCCDLLEGDFGRDFENIFNNALKNFSLDPLNPETLRAEYLKHIAIYTTLKPESAIPSPVMYCVDRNKDPDIIDLEDPDGPSYSTSTSETH